MWTSDFTELDELVFMLLRDPRHLPAEDVAGIVQHYLTRSAPRPSHADLLLIAVARPEFDDDLLDDVWRERADRPLAVRGARLAGLAARPGEDVRRLLRRERSLKARLYAAELTLSPPLLAELVLAAPPKLVVAALDNPHRPDDVDLAAIDLVEGPSCNVGRNITAMLRRTPRVEARVRASDDHAMRALAWSWCDSPQERLAFATAEIRSVLATGETHGFIDAVLRTDEAAELPRALLSDLEAMLDAALVALVDDDSYWGTYWRSDKQAMLAQVRRALDAQADEPHPPVAVLLDRIAYADWGEATREAEQRLLTEARALLGHGTAFWPALAHSFDVHASIPDLVSLAALLGARPTPRRRPAKGVAMPARPPRAAG